MRKLLLALTLLGFKAAPALAQKTAFQLVDVAMYHNGKPLYGGAHGTGNQTLTIDRKAKKLWLLSGVPTIENRLFQLLCVKQKPDTVKYVCKPITDGSPDTVFISVVPASKLIKLNGKKIEHPENAAFWVEYHYQ
jgi:hypothetical protein